MVDVAANRAATASTLSPRLRRLLDRGLRRRPASRPWTSWSRTDTVRVGEQVDVATAAWFPRDLRLQLRRPPTLQPPVIDGVWSFPQTTPSGIAATRNIRGRWVDLFVAHQVVFPLVAGTIGIPRATLKYSTPVALQFFSQEERFALSSRVDTLVVLALPAAGRPAGFAGAIGSHLTIERHVSPPSATVGEGVAVELRLAGDGNTALWPNPELQWPEDVRAYLERVDEQVTTAEGRVGGTKTFRYLVVPDSVGALPLPAVKYAYFDLASDHYQELDMPPASLPVSARDESAAAAALPPPLVGERRPPLAWSLAHRVPDWAVVALLSLPLLLLPVRIRRPVRTKRRRAAAVLRTDLRSAEEELDQLVQALAPDPDRRFGPALAAAVRAAGADVELAARVTAVRERLLARRYGPAAPAAADASLAAEAHEVVPPGWGVAARMAPARRMALLFLGFGIVGAGSLRAQNPAPEQLYGKQRRCMRRPTPSPQRATDQPAGGSPRWCNLGAAYYRLGARGRAEAAWLQARRLEPRGASVRPRSS